MNCALIESLQLVLARRECQLRDWKNGHKEKCPTLAADCQRVGSEVVAAMADLSLSEPERVEGLEKLDSGGPYAVAEDCGLYTVIKQLLEQDAAEAKIRCVLRDRNNCGR